MDAALQFPGVSNAWTQPIRARIDVLSTGIRTPVGIKVLGTDLKAMEVVARQVQAVVRPVAGTSSAYAERVIGGMVSSTVPTLVVISAVYALTKGWSLPQANPVEKTTREEPPHRRAAGVSAPRTGTLGFDPGREPLPPRRLDRG